MTDLRGFTAMSERLAPDEVIEILNQYFEVMTRVLMRYEATIDEFIGDAIFAIFGAPTTMPDHAERAVACAIAMQNAMAEVNDALTKRGRPELEMGIGLNTGDVVVGNVGSERRTKFGVVGRHVNLASRVESYTVGGQILAADSTIVGTRGLAKTRGSRIVEPKGIKGKILIHDVRAIEGPLALALTERPTSHELAVPNAPVALHASPIEGKDKLAERSLGRFLKLGSHGAVVAIERAFPVDANLQLTLVSDGGERLADDVVAKVVGLGPVEGTVELRFTSVSPEARQTIASLVPPGR
jgi:adenylate cyclase